MDIVVKPIDDTLVEGTESVVAKLIPPLTTNVPPYRVGSPSEAVVYIADNDLPDQEHLPIVNIYTRDAYASEGTNSMGTNTAIFVIRRSGETNSDLTVHYTIGGTSSNGVDYVTLPNSVTIPAGRYSAQIVVIPIEDNVVEGIETVVLKLRVPETTPAPYLLGWYRQAAAIIVDSDAPSPLSVGLPGNLFHLSLPGADGVYFRLEASTNLLDWITIDTATVSDGALHFVDSDAPAWKLRFYRAVPMPRPPPPEEK
ncbi:MAG: hypothetical protein DME26_08650 [Verrucomicrobia bacterium]|nr:MAG: hypothetical protein DME26_08650 [Verrucomicrobiota bacterium]